MKTTYKAKDLKPCETLHELLRTFEGSALARNLSKENKKWFIAGMVAGVHLHKGTHPKIELLQQLQREIVTTENSENYTF